MFMKKNKHYVSCMFLLGIVGAYVWMISRNGYGIRRSPSEYENYVNYPAHIKKKDKSAR